MGQLCCFFSEKSSHALLLIMGPDLQSSNSDGQLFQETPDFHPCCDETWTPRPRGSALLPAPALWPEMFHLKVKLSSVTHGPLSSPTVPPVILRLAEPEQRHDTCIEFTVRGYPHPKLRWFHKQKEIQQNDYIRTEMDFYQDYLEGCLTFQNPTHINNGNYTLEASNSLGTVTKTVYGHFLMAPDIDEGEQKTLRPLSFLQLSPSLKPRTFLLAKGSAQDSVTFPCAV